MNEIDKKALRQIMFGAAYAVAIAAIMAYRFNSWWWTLTAFPLGILFCDVANTKRVIMVGLSYMINSVRGAATDCRKVPAVIKKFLAELIPVGAIAVWIGGSIFLGSLWLPMIGTNLGILKDNVAWASANGLLMLSPILGLFLLAMFNVVLRDAAPVQKRRWKNGKSFFPLFLVATQSCGEKGFWKVMTPPSKKLSAFRATEEKVERFGDWKDAAGNHLSFRRFLRCLVGTGAMLCWPFAAVILSLFLLVLIVAILLDATASLLAALATNQSVSTGVGALVSAGLEVWLFPTFSFGVWGVARFFAFMLLGGVLGFGAYKLRDWRGGYADKVVSMLKSA